ncbi:MULTISPECIES: hypothetical protein [unclassified Tenacibaculum]|uniref:hypothetical protein n=1 Tax=unclassified Tenacibaculum TaxID=2635139 RepID=UPI001F2BA714|nr:MULTISPECIES: hypothetical protein [unclassified Tenacibaculum]MCF2874033.1 hypothetical protein [Tenacibaculum sp. Cn5-1]MCF2934614.1 hypothetical protein [Tenacibaculum sp. Cn5-34]MCG7510824.1 hypothetical protein [Tenacibaculum sp. Cn5-46]
MNRSIENLMNNLTIDECKSAILIADKEGYCHILGYGKIHKSNYEKRIKQLEKL